VFLPCRAAVRAGRLAQLNRNIIRFTGASPTVADASGLHFSDVHRDHFKVDGASRCHVYGATEPAFAPFSVILRLARLEKSPILDYIHFWMEMT
jgi:hypothetical protein